MSSKPDAEVEGERHVFALPDLGEGLTEAEIIRWLVQDGDVVAVNQPLVEVETAKAAVEIPSPVAGRVVERHGDEASTVAVGSPLVTFAAKEASEPLLVGYGVAASTTRRRARRPSASPHGTARPEAGPPGESVKPVRHGGLEIGRAAEARFANEAPSTAVRAKPPVRRLARELGVALGDVRPTGPDSTVTRDDVMAAAALLAPEPMGHEGSTTIVAVRDGEREGLRGIARAMANAMTVSSATIPQVTVWVEVDVSASRRLLARLADSPSFTGIKVSPLLLVARASLAAIRREPRLNSKYDAESQEIVHRTTVNLGIAAATPRGLVVPNIKEADTLTFPSLARALGTLTDIAREGASTPTDLTGGTFSITNVGVFGVDGGTPLINPGESAILAVGAWREKPWVVDGQIVPRTVATLSVTFDHRTIDGAMGSRFLRDVADLLEEPSADLAWDA